MPMSMSMSMPISISTTAKSSSQQCRKRRRISTEEAGDDDCQQLSSSSSLTFLLEQGQWDKALDMAKSQPEVVGTSLDPSPLAIACRSGAPYDCIQALLQAAPEHLRRVLDSRGTPLHEAIVCEQTETDVIELLLKVDEELDKHKHEHSSENTRATLLQDVDGFTPLHLLIRRRFQTHILQQTMNAHDNDNDDVNNDDDDVNNNNENNSSLMQILEMLVRSCPDAVIVPDRGEYEEPPIVYAIKANIYSPSLGSEDETLTRVERQIYEMVDLMLRYNPSAASRVFTGYRGQYTALHSAVFHGRFTSTIQLILRATTNTTTTSTTNTTQSSSSSQQQQQPALLQNTQGEVPLHFCAMRGEIPSSVALIANAAPQAVSKRDTSGLTPFHWLWIRFVSTLLTLEDGGRGTDTTIQLRHRNAATTTSTTNHHYNHSAYMDFAVLEQGNFDANLQLIKRMDPAVDFLRMRHIPVEVVNDVDGLQRANRSAEILQRIRERYYENNSSSSSATTTTTTTTEQQQQQQQQDEEQQEVEWTREQVVTALFWTKVVSLLQAANRAAPEPIRGEQILVHTAFASKCCLPAVAHMVSRMYQPELMIRDERGRLPLHYAALREWDRWDVPPPEEQGETATTASQLLRDDSLGVLKVALHVSPPQAVRVADDECRLVLHHAIDTMVSLPHCPRTKPVEMLQAILDIVNLYPDALQRRDGRSKLYPFLQATAAATTQQQQDQEHLATSITYELLRETPALLESTRRRRRQTS